MEETNLAFLDDFAGKGYENVSGDDFQIPFLKILQSLSEQVQKGSDSYVEGAEPGKFYNTLTNQIYGTTLSVIPIDFEKVWLEWKPNRGGFVGRHEPNSQNMVVDKSNFSDWKLSNGNTITEHYNFFCILPDFPETGIIVLSLSSSGIKHAKNWNSQIGFTRLPNGKQAPYFSSVWKLKTAFNKNEKGSWFSLGNNTTSIARERYISQNELIEFVLPAKESINKTKMNYAQLESSIKDESDLLIEDNISY